MPEVLGPGLQTKVRETPRQHRCVVEDSLPRNEPVSPVRVSLESAGPDERWGDP